MAIPASLQKGLTLPVISAPMFLVSGPDLVVEACNAGVIGTFPSLNQRTTEGYRDWIHEIKGRLKPDARRLRGQPHRPPDQSPADGRHDGVGRGEGAADHHFAGRRA